MLFTTRTVLVSSFNKRSPYQGVTDESLRQAHPTMDFFIMNEQARRKLVDLLPQGVITFNMMEVINHAIQQSDIEMIDITSLCRID